VKPETQSAEALPVWLVGSSGLLAGELARLLEGHPRLALETVVSREAGRELRGLHPQLTSEHKTVDLAAGSRSLVEHVRSIPGEGFAALLFLALPHGSAAATWRELAAALGEDARRVAVVDLSADFRLADPELHARHYSQPHPDPEGQQGFVYGLPEFHGSRLRESARVAAPGCFATALQLAVLPAAEAGLLDATSPWVLHGVTGSSGSGAAPLATTHHPFRHGSFKAYAPTGHRHEAELEQALAELGLSAPLHFLPHSGPWSRGIHLSAALPLAEEAEDDELRAAYARRYDVAPFVRLLEPGAIPELRAVVGSNRADLALHRRGRVLTVLLALDNTLKGGCGQALQCANLMLGLPESAGLSAAGLGY